MIKSSRAFIKRLRRRPTLPHSYPCSTIGAEELNILNKTGRVQDGNGCGSFAITTEKAYMQFFGSFNQDMNSIKHSESMW
jgi:hypothetical protein